MSSLFIGHSIQSNSMTWLLDPWGPHMSKNRELVADGQTLLQENLSENKYVEFARKLVILFLFQIYFIYLFQIFYLFQNLSNLSPFSESKYFKTTDLKSFDCFLFSHANILLLQRHWSEAVIKIKETFRRIDA